MAEDRLAKPRAAEQSTLENFILVKLVFEVVVVDEN
jgi:hypothetical protein